MGVTIVTDSTCDLSPQMLNEFGIKMVPLKVFFEDEVYKDWVEITPETFYKKLTSSTVLPRTSQPSPEEFLDIFKQEIENGNEIVSIHLSSKLSGTYNSACLARDMLDSQKVFVIDGKSASIGTGVLAILAKRLADEGMPAKDIASFIIQKTNTIRHIFAVETLEYLKKGGRISPAKATIGNILNIKPILHIVDGVVEPLDKVRGMKRALPRIIEEVNKKGLDLKNQVCGFCYAGDLSEVEELINTIKQEISPGELIVTQIGSVIGTYVGPGTFAFIFFEE
ncbi:DegV family protein [Anaerocellum diazotrophicum]|uniref:DegV family protein n=1 Tax=Caldicellulosiruptor diazotrophicus TaxID=2806205 RepID=A0ABN6EAA5_9FIRM|nr:DegV family protein [Caldicellulosiruptor diazotrophicus]BCS80501.1 DegV family protein [Caldicellulosiruptor diazotrophicus]